MQPQEQSHKHKHLAMMLEKMAVKDLAGRGRAGDTELGHLTPGDIVIPKERMTPEIKARLSDIAGGAKFDLDQFTVGHAKNNKNKDTGLPEFADSGGGDVGGVGGGDSPGPSPGGEHDAAKEAAAPGGNTFGGVSGTNAGFGGNAVGSAGQFGTLGGLTPDGTTAVTSSPADTSVLGTLGRATGLTTTDPQGQSQFDAIGFAGQTIGNILGNMSPLGPLNAIAGGYNLGNALLGNPGPTAPTFGDLGRRAATGLADSVFGDAANNPNGPGTQGTNPGERGGQPGIDRIIGQNPVATPNPAAAAPSPISAATVPQAPSVAQPAASPVRLPSGPTISDTTGNQANLATYLRDIGLGWFR